MDLGRGSSVMRFTVECVGEFDRGRCPDLEATVHELYSFNEMATANPIQPHQSSYQQGNNSPSPSFRTVLRAVFSPAR